MPDFTLGDEYSEPGDPISDEEAVRIIAKRLPDIPGYALRMQGVPFRERIAWAIVSQLPTEARTEIVLSSVDLRPLLRTYATTRYQASRGGPVTLPQHPTPQTTSDRFLRPIGNELGPDDREAMLHMMVAVREQARAQLEVELQRMGMPIEEIPIVVEEQLRDTMHSTTLQPLVIDPALGSEQILQGDIITDSTSGLPVAAPGSSPWVEDIAGLFAEIQTGSSTDVDVSFMTKDDLRTLLQIDTPNTVFGKYYDDLSLRAEYESVTGMQAPADTTNIEFFDRSMLPEHVRNLERQADRERRFGQRSTYTLSEALGLPINGMTRDEVATITDKMKRAGIFAQIEGGEPAVAGDATDPQFQRAWKLLLAKSLQGNRPINDILRDDATAYDAVVEEQTRALLTDPARIRAAANTIARAELGRKLKPRELTRYVSAIHELQRDQAEAEAAETGDVVSLDWQARMEELIQRDFAAEAGAKDISEQYELFRSVIGGPGRGIST